MRMLLLYSATKNFNKTKAANQLRITRGTATKYINAFRQASSTTFEIEHAHGDKLYPLLFHTRKHHTQSKKALLTGRLASIHSRIENDGLSVLDAWRED